MAYGNKFPEIRVPLEQQQTQHISLRGQASRSTKIAASWHGDRYPTFWQCLRDADTCSDMKTIQNESNILKHLDRYESSSIQIWWLILMLRTVWDELL